MYSFEILEKRLREQAFLNAGLQITLNDKRESESRTEVMHYEGGIRSFVGFINKTRGLEALHPDPIYFAGERNGSTAEVALQYTDSYYEGRHA